MLQYYFARYPTDDVHIANRSKSKSKKTLFQVGTVKQQKISSHLY